MVETDNSLDNYPLPWELSKLFQGATAVWTILDLKTPKPEDIAVSLASAGTVYALISTLSDLSVCLFSTPKCQQHDMPQKSLEQFRATFPPDDRTPPQT